MCKPNTEWDSFRKKLVYFNKPKFFIGIDRDDLMLINSHFQKKEKYINVNIPIEKLKKNASYTYAFIKAGELVANKSGAIIL